MGKETTDNDELTKNIGRIANSMYVANMRNLYRDMYDNGFVNIECYERMLWNLADVETENREV